MLRSTNATRTEPISEREPVGVAELKQQLRISDDNNTEDDLLRDLAAEARRVAEDLKLHKVLITQTCVDKFDAFDDEMELRFAPVVSVTSIQYVDSNGDTQTLGTSVYELGTRHGMGIVRLQYGESWPTARSHEDVITITYQAGYGTTPADVPKGIRRWIAAYAAWLYECRFGEPYEFPQRMDGVLAPYATDMVIG